MKTLCSTGHLISLADRKALDHYLLDTPKEWAEKALKGMIFKAVKTLYNNYFETYKGTCQTTASLDPAIYIPAILALPDFDPYDMESLKAEDPLRIQDVTEEIWETGFDLEDFEYDALYGYFKDPEEHLAQLMENKIAKRKSAFELEIQRDPANTEIPVQIDEAIEMQTAKLEYLNRIERDAAEAAQE